MQLGGDHQDFNSWRKKPPSQSFLQFCYIHRIDPPDQVNEDQADKVHTVANSHVKQVVTQAGQASQAVPQPNHEFKMTGAGLTPVAVSTTLPVQVARLSQQSKSPFLITISPRRFHNVKGVDKSLLDSIF